jgi:hypothetical protein
MDTITASFTDIFKRPADDNYDSMQELLDASEQEMNESRELKIEGAEVLFQHSDGQMFPLTNYSMTQVAGMAEIRTRVLERLHQKERDDLLVDNLNTLFPNDRSKTKFILVRDRFDDLHMDSVARAVNGGAYSRLWDFEVFSEMEDLLMSNGFTPKLPHLRIGMRRSGFMHGLNTGLFRGDQCSFGFFFAEDELEGDSSNLGGLTPCMMVWNSEVGARSFGFHTCYYHEKSGSVIIWTPSKHKRKRFVHRGNIHKAFKEYVNVLEDTARNFQARYTDSLATFNNAALTPFASDGDAAVQRLHKTFGMSVASAKAAVAASTLPSNNDGMPLSVWRIALGIAWEAGITSRAESMVDNTLVATKMMRSILKV